MDASFRPPCATDGIIPSTSRQREGGEDCARSFHGTCSSNALDYCSRNIRFGAGRISRMDLFVENNCRYFFSFFLVRLLFTVPYFSFRYFIYYSHISKIFYILILVK